ncbi:MAG: tetratricopeptide repeat protein [Bryobacteraceae bacterium]|nr:tetratricopeptide repeat protein [Bryobacteraceae bacterium]
MGMTPEVPAGSAASALANGELESRIDALNEEGWQLREAEGWKGMLALAAEALELARAAEYKRGIAQALRNSCFAHYMCADYPTAVKEALQSLEYAQDSCCPRAEAEARMMLGILQWSLGNYDDAMREGLRALEMAEALGDVLGQAWCLNGLGGVYLSLGDCEQALSHHLRAFALFKQTGYRLGEARALTGIGSAFHALEDYAEARRFHEQSLELYQSLRNRVGESRALNDLGSICQDLGEDEKALELHEKALAIRREIGNRPAEATSLLFLGKLHAKRGQHELALAMLGDAREIAEEAGAKPKAFLAHHGLAEVHEALGNLALALHHYKEFTRIREQVFSEESASRMRNLQISVEVERSKKEAEAQRQRNVELAHLLDELKQTQAQLVQSERMAALGSLVAALGHEINSPLGAIRSGADIALRSAERLSEAVRSAASLERLREDRAVQRALEAMRESQEVSGAALRRIEKLVGGLKSFARYDRAAYERVDLNDSIEGTVTLMEPVLRGRVEVVREYDEIPQVYCYAAEMNQVFMNLLTNAAEAIDGTGAITVKTCACDKELTIAITDTGRGIPAEQLKSLFTPGFTVKEKRVQASVSLFASLNIVRKHGGEIRVASEVGKGSTFTVALPRSLETQAVEPSL